MDFSPRRLLNLARSFRLTNGYRFDRPLLLLQSDDWGRVGLRDNETVEGLRREGLPLGERVYDLYGFESAEDVAALAQLLKRHRDRMGRPACITMNFIMANLDFGKMASEQLRQIHLIPLCDGLPEGWQRPGLFDSYREGAEAGVFYPALHGLTHFCRPAIERELTSGSERVELLMRLWRVGVPYIYWRMPWVGYEYWGPERAPKERFLSASEQDEIIGSAIGNFVRLFSQLPRSACAPGYRANHDTHRAWAHYGVRVAQNGPGSANPPHLDSNGLLHLYRTLDFEPALHPELSIEDAVRSISESFATGMPAVISVHSINFHSAIQDFRSRTLELLDQLLSALESRHPDLLYVHDGDVYDLVQSGCYAHDSTTVMVGVSKRSFSRV
jgi:hypothetical protein